MLTKKYYSFYILELFNVAYKFVKNIFFLSFKDIYIYKLLNVAFIILVNFFLYKIICSHLSPMFKRHMIFGVVCFYWFVFKLKDIQ